MKRFLIISFFVLNTLFLSAQTEGVGINSTGAEPDSSAMLDIQSSTKGLLIPRMDSSSRIAISNPAEGLMVYDSTTQSFWYYQQAWQELGKNIPAEIRDADGDTYVQVEATADEDNIRLGVKGGEAVTIDSTAVKVRADLFAGSVFEDGSSRIVNQSSAVNLTVSNNTSPGWQSFTATTNGKLNEIDLFILPNQQRNYTINFYEGEGTGGKLLSTTNIAAPAFSGWNRFSFPTEVVLDKGTIYTVGFSSIRSIYANTGNVYPGGRSSENPDEDFRLRVFAFVESYGVSVVGGNVGIGTTNPARRLSVSGSASISDSLGIGTTNPSQPLSVSGSAYISNRLGIGTDNPARTLTVVSDTWDNDSTGGGDIKIINSGNVAAGITLQSTTTGGRTYSLISTGPGADPGAGSFGIWDQTTANYRMVIKPNGNIGIGTDDPIKAKVQIDGSASTNIGAYGVLDSRGRTGLSRSGPANFSLWASSRIAAFEFVAHSDARIKDIQGISNAKTDLSTLMKIEVTDYRLRDSIAKGTRSVKKVIAQQVAEVYPQAVTNTLTEVVPDIYQRAEVQDGWIMLPTDLQVGERVKVITESSSEVHEVTAVEADRFQVSLLKTGNRELLSEAKSRKAGKTVFIYGREVNDFHTVDYEAISMLNVSATQELKRTIDAQQAEINSQQAEIDAQQAEINALTRQLQAFQSLETEQSRLAQELAILKAALHTQP